MTINDRIRSLKDEFDLLDDWEEKYRHIIQQGKKLPEIDNQYKTDKYLVKGCQSQVWLTAEFIDGRVNLFADSDAHIVKGLVSILLRVYSGSSPDEILETEPAFLSELGLDSHLSQNRANGLAAMMKQVRNFALAFKLKTESGNIT